MDASESLRSFGMIPADDSLPRVRDLLEQQTLAAQRGQACEQELVLLSCVQLFSRGLLGDILRIWKAKCSSFDNGCIVDIQLLCGAGLEETKRYLSGQQDSAASEALRYLERCEAAGDFNGFTPARYLDHYRRYFGAAS